MLVRTTEPEWGSATGSSRPSGSSTPEDCGGRGAAPTGETALPPIGPESVPGSMAPRTQLERPDYTHQLQELEEEQVDPPHEQEEQAPAATIALSRKVMYSPRLELWVTCSSTGIS